jgi:hypothetical protein
MAVLKWKSASSMPQDVRSTGCETSKDPAEARNLHSRCRDIVTSEPGHGETIFGTVDSGEEKLQGWISLRLFTLNSKCYNVLIEI